MIARFPGSLIWLPALVVLSALSTPALWAQESYLLDDAKLSGKSLCFFEDQGQQVTVVDGNFLLRVGGRKLSGQSAVMWVTEEASGDIIRRRICIYIEGRAQAIEPSGSAVNDRTMVVHMRQQGRLTASGKVIEPDLDEMPIYQRALAARLKVESPPTTRPRPSVAQKTTTQPSIPQVQITIDNPTSTQPSNNNVQQTAATAPAALVTENRPRPLPPVMPLDQASGSASDEKQQPPVTTVPPPSTEPVEFSAEQVVSRELSPTLRSVVLRGKVYLSQGTPEGLLELRAQAAVIFTEKNLPGKDVRSPLSPDIGTFGQDETVAGVYLEGDVIISRGDRSLMATKAYYDFTTDRATLIDPVFRTIQEQRNIPIYIRAKEARLLSARELHFKDAVVTTSDFHTPSFSIQSNEVYLKDMTPYDKQGNRIGEQSLEMAMKNSTYRIQDFPLLYWPYMAGDFTDFETPLRRVSIGGNGRFGSGLETEWDLFGLLGLATPEGTRANLELDYLSRTSLAGVDYKYARRTDQRQYTGYGLLYAVNDSKGEDDFGRERKDIPAPEFRGRTLTRHKEFLPRDWELQFELSYICDRNFMEQFFRDEFWAGKEQETLLYAKKQRDNWAFTSLVQYRLNRFQTQTESWPDLGLFLLGEPLADGMFTFFSENHAGVKNWRPDNAADLDESGAMARGDTRNEINMPMHLGPVNVTPYMVGRGTGWSESLPGGEESRAYGQAGVKSNMDFWRVYNNVHSRLWDLNRLKHVITPEVVGFLGCTSVQPNELYPMDPDIEQHLTSVSGASFGIYQRLLTKRGLKGHEKTVDWMRLDLTVNYFEDEDNTLPADGRFFFSRPEYSLARDSINMDYTWNISDATAFLSTVNYDVESQGLGRFDAGFVVQRNPRLRYYFGVRSIRDLDTTVGTFGLTYRISPKYSFSFFEQYDFDYDGGTNLVTTLSIIRKFERWYAGLSVEMDRTQESIGIFLTLWPEGIPEVKLGSGRLSPLGSSSMN